MGFFSHDDSDERQAYEQVQREGSTSHEVVAGAASFMAMRKYMEKQESEGKPESFETAKEIIAAIAGAEADKLIETKGLTEVDRLRARHQAEENAKRALAQSGQYGDSQYQYQSFEQSRYGGGGGGGYGGDRREEYGRGGQGGGFEGGRGGFDGQGGFPGDQEMRGGRMEGRGYGGGPGQVGYDGQEGFRGEGQHHGHHGGGEFRGEGFQGQGAGGYGREGEFRREGGGYEGGGRY